MKTKQLIISFLGLSTIVACSSDRDQETTTPSYNSKTSASVKSARVISDTIKLNTKSQLNDRTEETGEEPGAEIIPPGEVRPPKK